MFTETKSSHCVRWPYVAVASSSVSAGSAPHTWTLPSMDVSRRVSVGWKDSDWTTALPTGSFRVKDPCRSEKQTSSIVTQYLCIRRLMMAESHYFILTQNRKELKIAYVELDTDFHQVPEVDMSVLWAAQDVSILTRQAAVQLVALHLVSRKPEWNKQEHPNRKGLSWHPSKLYGFTFW